MSNDNIIYLSGIEEIKDPLTDILRDGARLLLCTAIEAELAEFLKRHEDRRTVQGRKAVVRNGYHPERSIQTGLGPVSVHIPKVRANDGEPVSFHSLVVPPYVRKSRTVESWTPWLYLKGISTGVISGLLGKCAEGLSASVVKRLKQVWVDEMNKWQRRDLGDRNWAYVWADGVYSGLRNEETKLCCLPVLGRKVKKVQIPTQP